MGRWSGIGKRLGAMDRCKSGGDSRRATTHRQPALGASMRRPTGRWSVRAAGGEPVPARFRQTAIPTEFSYLLSSSRQPTCATEEFGGDALSSLISVPAKSTTAKLPFLHGTLAKSLVERFLMSVRKVNACRFPAKTGGEVGRLAQRAEFRDPRRAAGDAAPACDT